MASWGGVEDKEAADQARGREVGTQSVQGKFFIFLPAVVKRKYLSTATG